MNDYLKQINVAKDKEEIKKIVRVMFKDIELDDIDFNDIIYDFVIPKLKMFGVDMEYNEETRETNYERIMRENY